MNARWLSLLFLALGGSALGQQGQSVIDSVHNLSASGPGGIHAVAEDQVCIFCHTPHNAAPVQPLWNRAMPVDAYTVYSSNALDAEPGQPTGSSKLCLSCHDGTIALGSVLSRDQIIVMAGGITTLPPGHSNLGTDLSDDHPISFPYTAGLVGHDPNLVHPGALPADLRLDGNQELQCTTCHDAHDNTFGDFLVMSNDDAMLCKSCHQISTTTVPAHRDCRSCHRTHTAPSGPYLLVGDKITTSCLACHDGTYPGAKDIAGELQKFDAHDTDAPVDPVDPIPHHVTCADCHDPHTMEQGMAQAPAIWPSFGAVSGVNLSGLEVAQAQYEYEVCFKCHADDNALDESYVSRVITQINTRLEFDPSAVSFHPVAAPGRNPNVPSLKPSYDESSMIYCSDCHGSEPGNPRGVHGSNIEPLLVRQYETQDLTPESPQAYALCYNCHYRDGANGILGDASFPHDLHVRDERTPCSVCHDAHGVSSLQGTLTGNAHLINFDATVVFPDPVTGRLEYRSTGQFQGECFLSCHNVPHSPKAYAQ